MLRNLFKSVRNRIVFLFVAVILIQVAVTSIFVVYNLKPHLIQTYSGHQKQMTGAFYWEMTNMFKNIENYSLNILGDKKIQQFLKNANQSPDSGYSSGMTTELRDTMLSYINYDSSISAIYLVDKHNRIYSNDIKRPMVEFIMSKITVANNAQGSVIWDSSYNGSSLVMYRVINDNKINLNEKIGAVFMVVDHRMFSDVFIKFKLDSRQRYAMFSKDGYMKIGDMEELGRIGYKPGFSGTENGFVFHSVSNEDRELVTWIEQSVIYQPVGQLLSVIVFELLAVLVLITAFGIYLSVKITKPIADIKHAMKQMGKGKLGIEVQVSGDDEIGELAKTLNRMSKQIENLVGRITEDQRKQRILELRTMQYQINPHFLYNTLDTVNMITRKNNDLTSAELVTSLSNLFRISLSHGHEFIRLSDELQYMTYYLKIQSIRYSGAFKWETVVEGGIEDKMIMKFLLQPLVENSLNHGIRNSSESGCIWIKAYSEEKDIVLEVKDNGVGMTSADLEKIRASLEMPDMETDTRKGGFGLRNVHQRLKLYYGEGHGLHIESDWDEGTVITIRIPKDSDNV